MPRRSGGGGGMRRAPPPPPRRAPPPSPPARAPAPTSGATPQQQGPGLFGQMAATAGGVAIGSAVGHSVANMFSGGGGGGGGEVQQQQAPPQQQQGYGQQAQPCEFELRQFLDCANDSGDVSMCQGFNEALKDCRTRYGI